MGFLTSLGTLPTTCTTPRHGPSVNGPRTPGWTRSMDYWTIPVDHPQFLKMNLTRGLSKLRNLKWTKLWPLLSSRLCAPHIYTCSILSAIYNGSFLSGEGVTIFEGYMRRDSDSCTHPWPIYSTFRGKNLLGFHFVSGGWGIFAVFTFHDHIDLQIRQKNLDDSL